MEDARRPLRRGELLSSAQLARLWNIDLKKLLDLTRKSALPAHIFDRGSVSQASGDYLRTNGLKDIVFKPFEVHAFQCRFFEKIWDKSSDFQALSNFVKDYAGGLLLKPEGSIVAQDRLSACRYADRRWKSGERILTTHMAKDIPQNVDFKRKKPYTFRTIYNWIRKLAPIRKPGRPPKMT
jgi:hypothetical protein